jgi:hypothetical protein
MDIELAEKATRQGAIAGFFVAGLTLFIVSIAVLGQGGELFQSWNDPFNYLDVAIAAGLSVGVLKRSRTAAIILFCYYFLSQILLFAETGRPTGLVLSIVFLFFFGKAIRGTFAYHNIRKAADPDYRPGGRAKYFLWIPVIVIAVIFSGLIVLGTVTPSTAVLTGAELDQSDVDLLRAEGIVEQNEQIVLFYSAGFLSIREDGNILTDRRVISYEETDNRIDVYSATDAEIESISMVEKGNFLTDSLLLVTLRNGNSFYLFLSTENDGDNRFLETVEKRISR